MRRWVGQLARFDYLSRFLLLWLILAPLARAQDGVITLTPGMVGKEYSYSLTAADGTPPFKWELAKDALPPGLKLSSSGVIEGTPTYVGSKSSPYEFSVRVTESSKARLTTVQRCLIVIAPSTFHVTVAAPA